MGGGWLLQPLPVELAASKPITVPPAAAAAFDGVTVGEQVAHSPDTAYRQVVPAAPGPNGWKGDPLPCTVVGNPSGGAHGLASWTDYEVVDTGCGVWLIRILSYIII